VVSVEGGDCRDPNLGVYAHAGYGEEYGPGSRCITGRLAPTGYVASCDFSGCFAITCDNTNTKVTVTIGGEDVDCLFSEAGDEKEVPNMEGHFICPDGELMCKGTVANCVGSCYGHGTCMGEIGCQCDPGYYGDCRTECHNTCYTCDGPSDSDCTACYDDAVLSNGSCSCDSTEYWDPYYQECISSCYGYTGAYETDNPENCTNISTEPMIGWKAGDATEYGHAYDNGNMSMSVYATDPAIYLPQGGFF
jgi:hypothetical protein